MFRPLFFTTNVKKDADGLSRECVNSSPVLIVKLHLFLSANTSYEATRVTSVIPHRLFDKIRQDKKEGNKTGPNKNKDKRKGCTYMSTVTIMISRINTLTAYCYVYIHVYGNDNDKSNKDAYCVSLLVLELEV